MQLQLFRRGLAAQTADAVRLPCAHFLQKPAVGIIPLVIDEAADGIQKIGLLRIKISRYKPSPLRYRIADQLTQQLRDRLQQMLSARGKAVVNQAGHKTHALIFAFFTHCIVDPGAVQPVQPGRKLPHVRSADRAPPQHSRQQRPGAGRLLLQRRDKLGREQTGLEFTRRQIRQIYTVGQLNSGHFQNFSSFWNPARPKAPSGQRVSCNFHILRPQAVRLLRLQIPIGQDASILLYYSIVPHVFQTFSHLPPFSVPGAKKSRMPTASGTVFTAKPAGNFPGRSSPAPERTSPAFPARKRGSRCRSNPPVPGRRRFPARKTRRNQTRRPHAPPP